MHQKLEGSVLLNPSQKQPSIWLMILSGQPKIVSTTFSLDNVKKVKGSLSFRVNGTKHLGSISIVTDEASKTFKINYIADSNPDVTETLETISIAELTAYNSNPIKHIDTETIELIQKEYGFLKM